MDQPLTPLPRHLLDALADAGFQVPALAKAAGLDALQLETGLTRMQADRFLCAAWIAVGDPAFGLNAGQRLRPDRMGVSGLVAMTSPDFGTALRRKAHYNRLVWGDDYQITEGSERLEVAVIALDEDRPYGAAKIDMELMSLLTFGRQFTQSPIRPVAVWLRQAAPPYRDLYRQAFGLEPAFGMHTNGIAFRRQDAALKLVSANAAAHAGLVEVAESELSRLDQPGVAARVRNEFHKLLGGEEPTLVDVARRLSMSTRTLQRRLTAEGVAFSKLLDDTRCEFAKRKLRVGNATAAELAFLLSFADTNSFYRAFKRWTGTTPEIYRRQAKAQHAAQA